MSLPIDKPCIFCGGKYEKIFSDEQYEENDISTLVFSKHDGKTLKVAKCVIYKCGTCRNIQSFLEEKPRV